jgi:hypothetical protein
MIRIDRSVYKSSHGKLPRGRGLWIFAVRRGGAYTELAPISGLFGDALARAKAEARSIGGAEEIIVQP